MIVELKQDARPFGLRRGSLRENRERSLNFTSWNLVRGLLLRLKNLRRASRATSASEIVGGPSSRRTR